MTLYQVLADLEAAAGTPVTIRIQNVPDCQAVWVRCSAGNGGAVSRYVSDAAAKAAKFDVILADIHSMADDFRMLAAAKNVF